MVSILLAQPVKIIPSQQVETRNGKQFFVHTVKKGQTIYSIARAYNVSTDEIYYENPSAKKAISINQTLFIPLINKETEIREEIKTADFEFFYHVCSENETFSQLAEIYLQPENSIRKANPNSIPPFREGEYLKIPVDSPESRMKTESAGFISEQANNSNSVSFNPNIPVLPNRHIVVYGETTNSIAKKYLVSTSELKSVNPGLGDNISEGERLRIPATALLNGEETKQNQQSNAAATTEISKTPEQETKPIEQEYVMHKVKKKETIYRISRDYGVTIQELYDANPGLTEKLKVGQLIKIPKKRISNNFIIFEASGKTKVKKLAKMYGISESLIKMQNPDIGKFVYRGEDVKIPVGSKALIVSEEEIKETTEENLEDKLTEADFETDIAGPCSKEPIEGNYELKIALMVPLFLDDLQDSVQVSKVLNGDAQGFQPFMFVNFLEGAMMAVDSLRKAGINVKLKVYDVDKSITKTTKVLQDPDLKNVDLIIGPFYNQSFNQVALFAGNFNIPIVNPLSYRSKILKEYKTAIKIKPSEYTQIPLVTEIIKQSHPNAKLFFITQNSYRDADKTIIFENALKEIVKPSVKHSNKDLYDYCKLVAMRDEEWVEEDGLASYQMEGKRIDPALLKENLSDSTFFYSSLVRINYSAEGFEPFMNNASAFRENVVVVYASDKRDKAFVMDVMNKLNEFRDSLSISLIGVPLWERLENIDLIQMDNLKTIDFESSFIDYDKRDVQEFIYAFRKQYSTDPGKYGFAGYDITMYFSNSMYYFNTNFMNCLPYFKSKGLSGSMLFNKSFLDNSSFENINWIIIKHQNLKRKEIYLNLPTNK